MQPTLSSVQPPPDALQLASQVLSRGPFRTILFSGLTAVLIYLRDPRFFTSPRFWAEEGSLHFAYSYSHGWLQALFNPQVGYLNFWPNLATLLATTVPLQSAPLITTLLAFAAQLLPVVLILTSRSTLWMGWWRKALGVGVVLFFPLTTEVWLNTINSFTYLAAAAFLILLEQPPDAGIRRWMNCVLLVVCGLTGTLACFLAPIFAYLAITERSTERRWQTLILSACAVVQAVLIFNFKFSAWGNIDQRFGVIGPTALGAALSDPKPGPVW